MGKIVDGVTVFFLDGHCNGVHTGVHASEVVYQRMSVGERKSDRAGALCRVWHHRRYGLAASCFGEGSDGILNEERVIGRGMYGVEG